MRLSIVLVKVVIVRKSNHPYVYKNLTDVSYGAGVTNQMLSCITGCVFVVEGTRDGRSTDKLKKINIGLNLKFNKKVGGFFFVSIHA